MSLQQILSAARYVRTHGETGPLSTGEALAACLVLNRTDLLEARRYTALEALRRVESGGWSLDLLIEAQMEMEVEP